MERTDRKQIFEQLRTLNRNQENRISTVIEGPCQGAKVLVSGGKVIGGIDPKGFFAAHPEYISCAEAGLTEADGVRVYTERISGSKKMVICGGGHVGCAVAKIGIMIGMEVTVIDDRKEFTDQAAAIGAEALCGGFLETLAGIEGDDNTYFVIMTRGHKWDRECLKAVITKPHAYIGMIGSRSKVKYVLENLAAEGADAEVLKQVFTPIGLSIGAKTPEEIAVSVLAEVIQVKNARQSDTGYSREILDAILGDHHEGIDADSRILVTIVNRSGSAPREAGAKLVLLSDGQRFAGTIGGGLVEAQALSLARRMLQENTDVRLIHVNMSEEEAGDEGMVCGGQVEILLEKL